MIYSVSNTEADLDDEHAARDSRRVCGDRQDRHNVAASGRPDSRLAAASTGEAEGKGCATDWAASVARPGRTALIVGGKLQAVLNPVGCFPGLQLLP